MMTAITEFAIYLLSALSNRGTANTAEAVLETRIEYAAPRSP
jgi:hypothetical protein